jgi:hypothetical protein
MLVGGLDRVAKATRALQASIIDVWRRLPGRAEDERPERHAAETAGRKLATDQGQDWPEAVRV